VSPREVASSGEGASRRPVALVTGATRRVGLAIATALAEAGCDLILTYRSSEAEAQATAKRLREACRASVEVKPLDLNDLNAVEQFGRELASSSEPIDVLVHNASVYERTLLSELTAAGAMEQFRINALAPLLLTKELAMKLGQSEMRGGGAVVAMLDIHAMGLPRSGYSAYAMSKAALHEMVRSLARELAPRVRVNGVAPGVVAWPESGEESSAAMRAAYLSRVPLGRAGTPEDAAGAVRWLALEAPYVTGQVVRVDGGRSLM